MPRTAHRTAKIPAAPETEIQRAAIDLLKILGCEVLVTSRVRKRCHRCGNFSAGGDGASKGLPDLFIRKAYWPTYLWLGIEIKGDNTVVRPEQKDLSDRGGVHICRGMDAVMELPAFVAAVSLSVLPS